ncbi:hypothetical protein HK413_04505 [Mucilaginibacter sp. S1162]|uniref:Uncharacterized protein n=1 Tax=Mucilaginibacter humi TaxID=2732510 RepID=A0ABX1W3M8_9SPHI|nr:hypothetical protein [Mucilaginibacter humi]NNU33590.1 hypothetical protein [Mucilaginibacter humi]
MGLNCNISTRAFETIFESGDGYSIRAKVYLEITDESGQPANGNNITVNYSINDNGVITQEQKTVAGQSALLFYGIIERGTDDGFGDIRISYTKTFGFATIAGNPDPTAPPPVNFCDLLITAINVDKAESAPGAADAQITVTAASSYLPLHYSLDNVTFQTSNLFTGLTAGLKTVYVTDSNSLGCSANRSITVPVLNSLLVSDPSVTVGSNISRWNAAFNPVVFTYQRKDFDVVSVTVDSLTGNAKVSVNATLNGVVAKDLVYINTSAYKGTFSVISNTGNALIIDAPYTSNAAGFININRLRPYYKVVTRITYQDVVTGQTKTILSNNTPDNTGLVKADLSNFLQSLVRAKDDSAFTQPNFKDSNLSASYQIAYSEQWNKTDNTPFDWVNIPDQYYVVYAAKQLGERYSGNWRLMFRLQTGSHLPVDH